MNAHLAITKQGITEDKKDTGKPIDPKAKLYEQVIEDYQQEWRKLSTDSQQNWYNHRYEQYSAALQDELGRSHTTEFTMKSISPLLVGHGGVSALEASLNLHRIYGVPYIPGSAVKGATAHYCHRVLGRENSEFLADGEYYKALFGTKDQAGYICYHDAWVTPNTVRTALIEEVMTPHHQQYNSIQLQQTDHQTVAAPRDDDDPIPLPYLAVFAEFRFILTCSADRIQDEQAKKWVDISAEIVAHALEHEGIGGKTNAGYGRMIKAIRGE